MELEQIFNSFWNWGARNIAIAGIALTAAIISAILFWSAPSKVFAASFNCELDRNATLEAVAKPEYESALERQSAIRDFDFSIMAANGAAQYIVYPMYAVHPRGPDQDDIDIQSLSPDTQMFVARDMQQYQQNMAKFAAAYERVKSLGDFGYGQLPEFEFQDLDSSDPNVAYSAMRVTARNLVSNLSSFRQTNLKLGRGALALMMITAPRLLLIEKEKLELQEVGTADLRRDLKLRSQISDECGGTSLRFRLALFRAGL
ncbi:MAG TPA: hypothetical protein VGH02_00815 [Rhizomicrobium sp.]|jgi:hypothetical protein